MRLNEATIPHYRSKMIPTNKLKKKVLLNEEYLREKPTWYEIDDSLKYFKIRNDFRLFAELFFSKFAHSIMGLQTLDYSLAYIRTQKPNIPQSKEETKCGLLSETFQDLSNNHYLVSELMQSEISNFISYGGYNLSSLLNFFKDYIAKKEYTENELFLIKLFISDAFTYQVDRNPNNIAFQIPKIPDVSYRNRLYPEILSKIPTNKEYLEYDSERGIYLLKGFQPNVVFDNERILGIDHKDVLTYNPENCWKPLFPYSSDLDFSQLTDEEANQIRDEKFDGLDPNLCSLYMDYPELCTPYFERLAYDDEYRKILEEFRGDASPVILSDSDYEYVTNALEHQREVFKRILKF